MAAERARIRDISNYDAEKTVIGCFLSDPKTLEFVKQMSAEDFHDANLREIFKLVRSLCQEKKPVDLITASNAATAAKKNGLDVLMMECMQFVPSTVMCYSYVDIVREHSLRRQIAGIAEGLYRAMGEMGTEVLSSVELAKARLRDISGPQASQWKSIVDVLMASFEDIEKRRKGEIVPIRTGLPSLDYVMGGLYGGEVTVIGARPTVGKSAVGMFIALQAAKSGKYPGFCSVEMSDIQIGNRLLSYGSSINGMKFRKAEMTDDEMVKVLDAANKMSSFNMHFLFRARTIEELVAAAGKKRDAGELDLLVVDYLQLLRSSSRRFENQRLLIGHISREIKHLAMDLNIPIISLAQLRRPAPGRASVLPTMDDLKESGDIEQDADNILLLHRAESRDDPNIKDVDRANYDTWAAMGLQYMIMNLDKQRQGETCMIPALFNPSVMQLNSIERKKPDAAIAPPPQKMDSSSGWKQVEYDPKNPFKDQEG